MFRFMNTYGLER